MPVIGDHTRFAVEYQLDEDSHGVWMNGRIRYWCGGKPIGDWGQDVSLRDVLFATEQLLKYAGDRHSARFESLPAGEAFTTLRGGLFGREGVPEDERTVENEGWARHIALPWLESAGFVIESADLARLLTATGQSGDVEETRLRPGEHDSVLGQLQATLNARLESFGPGRPSH